MASFSVGKHLTDSVMVIFVSVKQNRPGNQFPLVYALQKKVDRLYRIAYYVCSQSSGAFGTSCVSRYTTTTLLVALLLLLISMPIMIVSVSR